MFSFFSKKKLKYVSTFISILTFLRLIYQNMIFKTNIDCVNFGYDGPTGNWTSGSNASDG